MLCGDASRLCLDHFAKHLSSVLGRTELCHEVRNPGPKNPKSSATKTTTWHCSRICHPQNLGAMGLQGKICWLAQKPSKICEKLWLPIASIDGKGCGQINTNLEDRSLLKFTHFGAFNSPRWGVNTGRFGKLVFLTQF